MSNKWLSDDELKKILGEKEVDRQIKVDDEKQDLYYEDLPKEIEIRQMQLEEFQEGFEPMTEKEAAGFHTLLDVGVEITVVLGRTRMTIQEILELETDSIIKLDKLAGEPAEIMIDNQVVARGDVVILDEQFAVEIKEIIHPRERVKTVQRKLLK